MAIGPAPSADRGDGVKTDDPVVDDDADGDDDSCTAGSNMASKSLDAEWKAVAPFPDGFMTGVIFPLPPALHGLGVLQVRGSAEL